MPGLQLGCFVTCQVRDDHIEKLDWQAGQTAASFQPRFGLIRSHSRNKVENENTKEVGWRPGQSIEECEMKSFEICGRSPTILMFPRESQSTG